MRRPLVWLILGGAGCFLAALPMSRPRQPGRVPSASHSAADEKHYVTPGQLTSAGSLAERKVVPFATGKPLALLFLKQGCPCNDDFEPFFRRLRRAYGDRVGFVGVIDAEGHEASYPVRHDPNLELIRLFEVDNSGYLILLRPDGTIDAAWPGWSRDMFEQVNLRVAALACVPAQPPDLEGLPNALTTGCPYRP